MSEQQKKTNNWMDFRMDHDSKTFIIVGFPKNITTPGRGARLAIGTYRLLPKKWFRSGFFTYGFLRQKGLCLFVGIMELLSAATAYSPLYDGYRIYKGRQQLPAAPVPKEDPKED